MLISSLKINSFKVIRKCCRAVTSATITRQNLRRMDFLLDTDQENDWTAIELTSMQRFEVTPLITL